jgi:Carboxypeptidase regulatory-like domain
MPRYSDLVRCVLMNPQVPLLLALFAWLSAAGQFAPEQTNKPEATYSLSGTVQNSVTGEPIAHALVQVMGRSEESTFTDAGGRFEFEHLPEGMTIVPAARKPGFLNPSEIDPALPQPMIRVGPDIAPLILNLVPEGVVYGRAQKADGEPIGYLTVQLFYFEIAEGRKTWSPTNSAQTNEEGEFRLAGLKPGRYYLQAGPRRQTTWIGAPGQRAREAAYRPVFYPGVNDLAAASPIDVSPGQQVEADLSLMPDPVFRIAGTVLGLPPDQNAGEVWPRIQILSRSHNIVAMPVGEESGNEFHAKVPAGSYILRDIVDTPQGRYLGDIPINVQSDLTGVNLVVAPAPAIKVEITVQRTHAIKVPSGQAMPGMEQVNVRLREQGGNLPSRDNFVSVSNRRDMQNTITNLEPGVYAVEVDAASNDFYVESAQCGTTDLLRDNLTLGQGPAAPMQIVLRDDGGTVSGKVVTDSGRAREASVLIVPDRAPRNVKTVGTGSGGEFHSQQLAPGDYTLLAFERRSGIEYANPEVLNTYLSYATHVSVTANGESKVNVNLIRTTK